MSKRFPMLRILVPSASYGECQIPIPLWLIILKFIATKCSFFGLKDPAVSILYTPTDKFQYYTLSEDLEEIDVFSLNSAGVSLLTLTGIDAAGEIVFFKNEQQYATVDSLEGHIIFWNFDFRDRLELEDLDVDPVYSFNIVTSEDLRDGSYYGTSR